MPALSELQEIIESYFEKRAELSPQKAPEEIKKAVKKTHDLLNSGDLRVAFPIGEPGLWQVNQWAKKAVLLSFALNDNKILTGTNTQYFDKVDSKFINYTEEDFRNQQIRVVPPAFVRNGSFLGKGVVLMPSYVNLGAYIDEGVMVDTWATVGSCAQIGKNVHLSGGVGIGGVLEPLQANPSIIEDDCFIGARSEIVEGVIVEKGSVISMGVYIGASTKIYDRETKLTTYGRVPAGSVVVAGNLPSQDGTHSMYAAIIVKKVDEKTRSKVGINELLRLVNS